MHEDYDLMNYEDGDNTPSSDFSEGEYLIHQHLGLANWYMGYAFWQMQICQIDDLGRGMFFDKLEDANPYLYKQETTPVFVKYCPTIFAILWILFAIGALVALGVNVITVILSWKQQIPLDEKFGICVIAMMTMVTYCVLYAVIENFIDRRYGKSTRFRKNGRIVMNKIWKVAKKYGIVSIKEKKWLEEQKKLRTLEQFVHHPWDFADHVHLHRIGSTIIIPKDYEPEKWYKYASENAHVGDVPCMKCICCGTEMSIDAISFNYHRHLGSPNAMDYAEFKCPECGAVYRTDPFVARHYVEDPGKVFRDERVAMAWVDSPEEIDKLPSVTSYSMEDDNGPGCMAFFIILIIGLIAFVLAGAFEKSMLMPITGICAIIDVVLYIWRRCTTQRFYKLPEERQLFEKEKSEQDHG